jgi:small subunit ribosomal protein S20
MPHTRSAKKSQRKNRKRRLHNRTALKAIKVQIKKVLEVATTNSIEELRKETSAAAKKLDKAAARRVIHPNLAARKKSQMAKLLYGKETAGKSAAPAKA